MVLTSTPAGAPQRPRPGWAKVASRPTWVEVLTQFGLVFGAAILYFVVRGLTEGEDSTAVKHGLDLFRLERSLDLDVELGLQSIVLGHHWVVTLGNWVYIWGHWPVIGLSLFWLHRSHPRDYLLLRNALFVSGAIGLVIFVAYPVAPPRLTPLPLIDTVTEFSTSYRVLQPPGLINKFAALPSLHAGWNVIVGIVVFHCSTHMARGRTIAKVFSTVLPVAMCVAVVMTGNHYVLDVFAGVAVSLVGLFAARHLVPRVGQAGRRSRLGRQASAFLSDGSDQSVSAFAPVSEPSSTQRWNSTAKRAGPSTRR